MAKQARFTFKLHPKMTGLAAVGNSRQDCDVKLNKLTVGRIDAPNWQTKDNKYKVCFSVKQTPTADNPNLDWKWIFLAKRTDTIEEMKEWLNTPAVINKLSETYEFHVID